MHLSLQWVQPPESIISIRVWKWRCRCATNFIMHPAVCDDTPCLGQLWFGALPSVTMCLVAFVPHIIINIVICLFKNIGCGHYRTFLYIMLTTMLTKYLLMVQDIIFLEHYVISPRFRKDFYWFLSSHSIWESNPLATYLIICFVYS